MILITGCAGFIGSHLTDTLLSRGNKVIGIDNLSTGQEQFLSEANKNKNFIFNKIDLLDANALNPIFKGVDTVFHLAANADVRFGIDHPRKDLEQNTIATFNVLEAMRKSDVKKICFSSTGSIYGESKIIPTPEDAPFPVQTSLYGASKVACEALISAYCEGFNFQSWIFRFVSIIGERYTHGHIFDFCKQLDKNPDFLNVLGNGKQRKSYLYVYDCIDAIIKSREYFSNKVNIINLGSDGYCEVNDSIGWITKYLNLKPELKFTGNDRGWIGDNPFIYLDTKKIQSSGWTAKTSIQDGVIKTVKYLDQNKWIFERRKD